MNARIARLNKMRQAALAAARVTLATDPRRRHMLRAQWWLFQARTATSPRDRAQCQADAAFYRNLAASVMAR